MNIKNRLCLTRVSLNSLSVCLHSYCCHFSLSVSFPALEPEIRRLAFAGYAYSVIPDGGAGFSVKSLVISQLSVNFDRSQNSGHYSANS